MSGGGRSLRWTGHEDLQSRISGATAATEDAKWSTEVADFLSSILSCINQKNVDAINQHKRAILDKLCSEFEGTFDLSVGGSYSRHTYVSGLSDVDILFNLGPYSNSNIPHKESCEAMIERVEQALRDRFPRTEIRSGNMAVTITFSDGNELQVLPAFRYGTGFKVPDPATGGWTTSYPNRFREALTAANKRLGGCLVPVVKLVKLICAKTATGTSSYHIEALAVTVFEGYAGPKTHADMVHHFFKMARTRVLTPIRDRSGQSLYVDEALTMPQRKKLAGQFDKIDRRMRNAKDSRSTDEWEALLCD